MASIKILLKKNKALTTGEMPIYIRITKDRVSRFLATGQVCHPDLWDEKLGWPKKKHPLYTELNVFLEKKRLDAGKLLLNLESEEEDYSATQVKTKLRKVSSKKKVLAYFDETITRLENSGRIGYANIFKSTKNSIKNFCDKTDIFFNEVNHKFIQDFEDHHLKNGVKPNSIFVYHRTFKTLINYARKEDLVRADFDPYKDISFTKFRRIKTLKRALTKDQITAISKLDLTLGSSIHNSQQLFMFSFYCGGMNFIDMAHLTWSQVKNGRVNYERKKTKELFNFGLLDPAKAILDYRREFRNSETGDYVFAILSNKYDSPKSIDTRIDRMSKIVNRDLKEIGRLAKIDEPLTTYVARHSYATILRKSGVATAVISQAMGHDSEKTTKIYLESFENSVVDKANEALL